VLVHYDRHPLTRRISSLADDPAFFLAPDGKHDPEAELEATLAALFSDEVRPLPGAPQVEQPLRCAFLARARWLRGALAVDPARLPDRPCDAYERWHATLNPIGVTLVFAEAFMGNPASMFGHTLLRLDTRETGGPQELLGWAINFAGITGNEGGPLYAIKGLFGLYPGYFDVGPYSQKVKSYGDWENRDIWEYELRLSAEEIDRMLEHLWELQGVDFDYYYFDENCSFQLLWLLESARPDLHLTDRFPLWVIPADTVRAVVRQSGLLGAVSYRPSAETELRFEVRRLGADDRRLARLIREGAVAPDDPLVLSLPPERRAAVLGVAYDELRYSYLARQVDRASSAPRSRQILVARSDVPVQGSPFPPVPTPAWRPDQGHGSARFSLMGGYRAGEPYVEARIRPALHRIIDPPGGYPRGSEIQFLDVALRFFPDQGELRLYEATLLDLRSLVPYDRTFRHLSYAFDTGLRTRLFPDDAGDLDPEPVWRTQGGVGVSTALGQRALLYALAQGTIDVGSHLGPAWALGVGASAGVYHATPVRRWDGHVFARAIGFVAGDTTADLQIGTEQRLTVSRDMALVAEASWHLDFGSSWSDAGLRWEVYF
jgi:Domain of unknown function (DUF4105)